MKVLSSPQHSPQFRLWVLHTRDFGQGSRREEGGYGDCSRKDHSNLRSKALARSATSLSGS